MPTRILLHSQVFLCHSAFSLNKCGNRGKCLQIRKRNDKLKLGNLIQRCKLGHFFFKCTVLVLGGLFCDCNMWIILYLDFFEFLVLRSIEFSFKL